MTAKVMINQFRTFVDDAGNFGNPTGIVMDLEHELSNPQRQQIATTLHFTDTVFVNRLNPFTVSFFNPEQETKFAGDSLISTSYFARNLLKLNPIYIECKGGHIHTWVDDTGIVWIESSLEGTPGWNHLQLPTPNAVTSITPKQATTYKHTMVWAWEDKKLGNIVSRTFLLDWGTLEDQGNGSGSMQLAATLDREIKIKQGLGSIIYAASTKPGTARVGGNVAVDPVITLII